MFTLLSRRPSIRLWPAPPMPSGWTHNKTALRVENAINRPSLLALNEENFWQGKTKTGISTSMHTEGNLWLLFCISALFGTVYNLLQKNEAEEVQPKSAHDPAGMTYDPNLRPFGMDTNEYQGLLQNQLVERKKNRDANYRQEKAGRLVEAVANAWLTKEDPEFDREIRQGLEAIAALRPGRKLLKQLFKLNPALKIKANTCVGDDGIHDSDLNLITLDPKNKNLEYVMLSRKIKILREENFYTTLVHELIHALHFSESKETATSNSKSYKILNKSFTNLEEQLTICGIESGKLQNFICENIFRLAWGQPLRINHAGFRETKEGGLSIRNWIDAYFLINEVDERKNKETINFSNKFAKALKSKSNSSCLEYAMRKNDDKLVRLLIDAGAEIDPKIVQLEPSIIKFAPHLLEREEILLAYFNKMPQAFLSISKTRQESKEFALKAVRSQPKVLAFLSPAMRDDAEIVYTALSQDNSRADTFDYASARLKNDPTFVGRLNVRYLQYAGNTLRDDSAFMLKKIQKSGRLIERASDRLRDDSTLGMEAVKSEGWALKFLSTRLRDDFNIVWEAVHRGGWSLAYVGPVMRDNPRIVLEALKSDPTAIRFASPRLQQDPEILAAVEAIERARE